MDNKPINYKNIKMELTLTALEEYLEDIFSRSLRIKYKDSSLLGMTKAKPKPKDLFKTKYIYE